MKSLHTPAWIILGAICIVAGLLLGVTNAVTAPAIEQQSIAAAEAARAKLLPEANSFEQLELPEDCVVDSAYQGMKGGEIVGYTALITVQGYGGPIEVTCGMLPDGTVTGITVGGSGFSETASLGARTKEAAFTDQFSGISVPIVLNEDVDQVTSATISSTAVVNGVNEAVEYMLSR